MRTEGLHVDAHYRHGVTITHPVGTLDFITYPALRDTLLKYAAEQPEGLLVELDDLAMASAHVAAVFSLVAMRVSDWPGIPVLLVMTDQARRSRLSDSLAGKDVQVHESVPAAIAALDRPPLRTRSVIELVPSPVSARRARYFVRMNCSRWGVAELATDAMTVVTAFVENTLVHTSSPAFLRLEHRHGVLTVAVTDDDPSPAVLRERLEGGVAPSGLLLVASVAQVWGCVPTMNGGKTVWALLRSARRRSTDLLTP